MGLLVRRQAGSEELPGSDGGPLIDIGETRDGGSYQQRMGHIAVWSLVLNEHNYLVRRWGISFGRAGSLA
ncbi:ABC transporter, binding protein [Pseudomonas chlororaphis]|nr:ABC transporter, binding protein [Pseudomonas chlororaphis]